MQMRLPRTLRVPYPLRHNPFRLLDILSMQINRVAIHAPDGIVFPEDIIGGLLIILIHHGAVSFTLFRELVRRRAIAAIVGLVGL